MSDVQSKRNSRTLVNKVVAAIAIAAAVLVYVLDLPSKIDSFTTSIGALFINKPTQSASECNVNLFKDAGWFNGCWRLEKNGLIYNITANGRSVIKTHRIDSPDHPIDKCPNVMFFVQRVGDFIHQTLLRQGDSCSETRRAAAWLSCIIDDDSYEDRFFINNLGEKVERTDFSFHRIDCP